MAKLKEADRYEELNGRQQQIVDLIAKYPNLPLSLIPRHVHEINDNSTYQYQINKEHDHIIEDRREHFKETGEYDEKMTELDVEDQNQFDTGAMGKGEGFDETSITGESSGMEDEIEGLLDELGEPTELHGDGVLRHAKARFIKLLEISYYAARNEYYETAYNLSRIAAQHYEEAMVAEI